MLAGVADGIAIYLEVDIALVRVIVTAVALCTGVSVELPPTVTPISPT